MVRRSEGVAAGDRGGLAEGLDAAARRRGRAASAGRARWRSRRRGAGRRRGRGGADRAARSTTRKERGAAAEAREDAQRREASRRETIARAAPAHARRRRAAARRRRAGGGGSSPPARRCCARVETAISDDARARADAGELRGPPAGHRSASPTRSGTDRADWPDRDLGAARGVYDCLVFVRAIADDGDQRRRPARLPVPRRARLRPLLRGVVQDQPGAGRARRARPAHGARAPARPAARGASRRTGQGGERASPMGSPDRDRSMT